MQLSERSTILTRVNSLKTWKNTKGVFWCSSARHRAFARFAQWL